MQTRQETDSHGCPDPSEWVDHYADFLFRYALHRVGDAATAEDLTQETFLAGLQRLDSGGQLSELAPIRD